LQNINIMENQNIEDNEMAQYIYKILSSRIIVLMSWGFQKPLNIKSGLCFSVNGFKFQGNVSIVYNEGMDLFDVTFINSENVRHTLSSIYFDQLVDVIDDYVEHVPNYNKKVKETYSLQGNED